MCQVGGEWGCWSQVRHQLFSFFMKAGLCEALNSVSVRLVNHSQILLHRFNFDCT